MGGTLELRNRFQSGGAVATLSFPRAEKPIKSFDSGLGEEGDLFDSLTSTAEDKS
jgi:hypothetical protein